MNDVLGKPLEPLSTKRLFLLDMDGTIYLDHTLIEGTLDMLDEIKKRGGKAVFVTNNSSRSAEDYVQNLKSMGISVTRQDFFTSSMGMALYLQSHHPGNAERG